MTAKHSRRQLAFVALLITLLLLPACAQHSLNVTPNVLLRENAREWFADVPPERQNPDIELIYATDRAEDSRNDLGPVYGYKRDVNLTFGTAVLKISPEVTWDQFIADSTTRERSRDYTLRPGAVTPMGQITPLAARLQFGEGQAVFDDASRAAAFAEWKPLQDLLSQRLAGAKTKDVYVFVHGFNNTFNDATERLGQLWHFMGRPGVAVAYTWPAGFGGVFGYAYDRESGEYTVHHLKLVLRAIAECPDVERIHVIAHSRGTDVAISAIREISLTAKYGDETLRKARKLDTLVLAAPDLDVQVFRARFMEEGAFNIVNRIAVYFSKDDEAIGLSTWLFSSRRRLGEARVTDFSEQIRKKLSEFGRLEVISCDVSGDSSTHDYAFANPAAASDLILLLRTQKPAGAENGRPLDQPEPGLWGITNSYLKPKP